MKHGGVPEGLATPGDDPGSFAHAEGSRLTERTTTEVVILFLAAILMAALGYTVSPILSPFVLTAAIVYLLYPLRDVILVRRLLNLSVGVFVLWFLYSLLGLLAPFIVAFLLAYILNPLVTNLARRGIPRWASSIGLVILMLAGATLAVLFVVPPVVQQFQSILTGVATIAKDASTVLQSGKVFDFLASWGVEVARAQTFIVEQLSPRLEAILSTLFQSVFGIITSASSLILHLINIIIIPFLFFYLVKDFPRIIERGAALFGGSQRDAVARIARRLDAILGRYFRGAILVAFIQGLISTIGLMVIGVKYPLVLGIMSGILDFIPYVGLLTSLVVSCIVALLSDDPVFTKVILVIALYLFQKLLEAVVLAPKIIGGQVGLHPVVLILSLLVFGYFLGFIGMLIAVPVTSVLSAMLDEWAQRRIAPPEVISV